MGSGGTPYLESSPLGGKRDGLLVSCGPPLQTRKPVPTGKCDNSAVHCNPCAFPLPPVWTSRFATPFPSLGGCLVGWGLVLTPPPLVPMTNTWCRRPMKCVTTYSRLPPVSLVDCCLLRILAITTECDCCWCPWNSRIQYSVVCGAQPLFWPPKFPTPAPRGSPPPPRGHHLIADV